MVDEPNFHRHRTDIAPTSTLGRKAISPSRKNGNTKKRKRKSRKKSRNHYPTKVRRERRVVEEEDEEFLTKSEFKNYFKRMLTEIHTTFEQQNERLTEVELLTVKMYHRIEKLTKNVDQLMNDKESMDNDWNDPESPEETPEKNHEDTPDLKTPFLSPLTFATKQQEKKFKDQMDDIDSNMNTPRTPKESDKYKSMVNDLKSEFTKSKEEEEEEEEEASQDVLIEESDTSSTYPQEQSPLNNNYLKALEGMDDEEEEEEKSSEMEGEEESEVEEIYDSPDKAAPSVNDVSLQNSPEEAVKEENINVQETIEEDIVEEDVVEEEKAEDKEEEDLEHTEEIQEDNKEERFEEEEKQEKQEEEDNRKEPTLSNIDTTNEPEEIQPPSNGGDSSPFDLDTMTLMTDISLDDEKHPHKNNTTPLTFGNEDIPFTTDSIKKTVVEEGEEGEEGEDEVSDSSMVYHDADTSEGSIYMRSDAEDSSPPPPSTTTTAPSPIEKEEEEEEKSEAEKQRDIYRETFFNSMGSVALAEYERYIYSVKDSRGHVEKKTLQICPLLTRMLTSVLLTFGNLSSLESLSVTHSFRDLKINAVIHSDEYIMDTNTAIESFSQGHNTNRYLDWMLLNLCSRQFCFSYKDSTGTSYKITWNDFLNPVVDDYIEGELPLENVWCEYEFYFIPHFLTLFGLPSLTQDHRVVSHSVLVEVAAVGEKNSIIRYNGEALPAQNLKEYAEFYWNVKNCQSLIVSPNFAVVIGSSEHDANPDPVSFVNAHLTAKGGSHVRHVRRCLNRAAISKESRMQLKRSQHSKYPDVIDHIQIFASVKIDIPTLNGDSSKLTKLPKSVGRITEKQALTLLRNLGLNLPISIDSLF